MSDAPAEIILDLDEDGNWVNRDTGEVIPPLGQEKEEEPVVEETEESE